MTTTGKKYVFEIHEDQVESIIVSDLKWSYENQIKYIVHPELRENESIQEIMDMYDALGKVLRYYMPYQEYQEYVAQCDAYMKEHTKESTDE
jgi:hypothetical protein